MGAWAEGNFSNDVALDFVDNLKTIEQLFQPIKSAASSASDLIDADLAAEALAAADLVASLLGRPAPDEPEHAASVLAEFGAPSDELLASTRAAVSAVLTNSELAELWNEGDGAAWEHVIDDLLARLDKDTPYKSAPKPAPAKGGFICSICGDIIPQAEIVRVEFSYMNMPGTSMGRYFHRTCIESNFEPPHFDESGGVPGSLKRKIKRFLRQREKDQAGS